MRRVIDQQPREGRFQEGWSDQSIVPNAAKKLGMVRTKKAALDETTWKSLEALAKAISMDWGATTA